MLDRPRLVLLGWAMLSFLLFGVVLLAVVQGWGPVKQFDNRGSPAAEYAVDSGWLVGPLRVIEVIFGTVGMTIMTAAVARADARPRTPAGGRSTPSASW